MPKKKEMNVEKAIEVLKKDKALCEFNPSTGENEPISEDCRQSAEALDFAIKALEEIATKGSYQDGYDEGYEKGFDDGYEEGWG